jgi:(p)ppGpp synthase/HD superfamily hydrolase
MSTQDPLLSDQFQEAFNYAFKLHRNQIRKGSDVPYLLHDAVEDQGGLETLDQIRQLFGEKVASIVEECTDSFSTPKPPWRERKLNYLQRLDHASTSALRVSLADKLHNLRSLLFAYLRDGEKIWKRFRGGKEGTLWYYHQLSSAFHAHVDNVMISEFDRVLRRLDRLIENDKDHE